jgi:hypothetical protein
LIPDFLIQNPPFQLSRKRPRSSAVTLSVATAVTSIPLYPSLRISKEVKGIDQTLTFLLIKDVSEEVRFTPVTLTKNPGQGDRFGDKENLLIYTKLVALVPEFFQR